MSSAAATVTDVVVTDHAKLRARERFGWKPARVREHVRDALASGRFSAVRQSWMGDPGGRHYRLYAWTEDQAAVFGLSGGDTAWHVYTVYRA